MSTEMIAPSDVAQVLVKTRGNKSEAARQLGVSSSAISTYVDRYPEIAEAVEDARQGLIDLAEDGLYDLLKQKRWPAIQYTLSTLGRNRGYGQTPTIDIDIIHQEMNIDLSDPRIREFAIKLTDAITSAAVVDGQFVDKGKVEVSSPLATTEPQDSGDARAPVETNGLHASEAREE